MKRKLGNDPNFWPQQIMEYLYSEYPFVAMYMQGIKFKTLDPRSGTALGGIILNNKASGMAAVVPVVISEFSMDNLDVFIVENEHYIPLNETRLTEYLGQPTGTLGKKKKGRGHMPVTSSPPGHASTMGNSGHTSFFKEASSSFGIGPGMLKILVDSMGGKEDGLVANRIKSLIKDIPYRAVWIFKTPEFGWKSISSDDRYNITETNGRVAILERFGSYDSNLSQEMDRSSNIFISRLDKKPFLLNDHVGPPTPLTTTGVASVMTAKNDVLIGQYCHDVTDLLGRPLGFALWYDGERYAMGEEMTGYYLRESNAGRETSLDLGCQYSFGFMKEGQYYSTAPFTPIEKPVVKGEGMSFKAKTHFGREVTIRYSKDTDQPFSSLGDAAEDLEGDVTYYIPTSYKLHKVGNKKVQLSYLVGKTFEDVLSSNLGGSIKVYGFNDGGLPSYYIKGVCAKKLITSDDPNYDQHFGKFAKDESTLIWYLINLGFSEGSARSIISTVWQNDGEAIVGNIANFNNKDLNINVPEELMVLAEDKLIPEDSVESVLGLGFINDLDVLDSIIFVDDIKQLESILAKLLFQIRIGAPLADEQNVSRALDYVSKVVDDLEVARISLEKKIK